MKIFQVDAFAENVFSGNPAAVVPLDNWLDDATMQNIAAENNLAETAYIVQAGEGFQIRWFTPTVEVDLCGHATLASAHVLYHHLGFPGDVIQFHSPRSGPLNVYRQGELLILDFPKDTIHQIANDPSHRNFFDAAPTEVYKGKSDVMFVFEDETIIQNMKPNLRAISELPVRGVIVTAPGKVVDFVSRFFAPQCGIDEDPVTGSAHTTLVPYWSKRLGKTDLSAIQWSKRRGLLACKDLGDRVLISGKAKTYMLGDIFI